MIMNQHTRDLYTATAMGWQSLDRWLTDPANAMAVSRVAGAIAPLRDDWHAVDAGVLTNGETLPRAFADLQTAEAYAHQVGYPVVRRAGGTAIEGTDAADAEAAKAKAMAQDIVKTGQQPPSVLDDPAEAIRRAAEDTAKQLSEEARHAINPNDEAFCQIIGAPAAICNKDGWKSPSLSDIPWWVWALGAGGTATLGLMVYIQYRVAKAAAPFAIAAYAPEALPAYQALVASNKTEAQQHVLKAVAEEGARRRAQAEIPVVSGISKTKVSAT